MKHLGSLLLACTLLVLVSAPRPSHAAFHFAVIDEIMTSYGGDPNIQFVEIKMLAVAQAFVTDSVLGAFDQDGAYLGDVLIVPGNVVVSGPGVRWLMATAAFETLSGLTPDFPMPATLPSGGGMVCWGAPGPGGSVPDPDSWDHSDPNQYVDCVAYGSYSGPSNALIGNPTPLNADGHSLVRGSQTNDNETDFGCGNPATPENNAPQSASVDATAPCPSIPTVPGWGATLLTGLLVGAGTLLLLRRRTGLGLSPPPQ